MNRGFLATLCAAAFSFAGMQAAYSAAPVIAPLPDVQIGDLEDPVGGPGGTDSNLFVFANAFQFSAHVSDADTPVADLAWSFGEYDPIGGAAPSRYEINGVGPVYNGTVAIANGEAVNHDEAAGDDPLEPGSKQINSGAVGDPGDWASFRDILFSPVGDPVPFPDPSAQDAADAAAGKGVRFYVSDGENVRFRNVWVSTVDNSTDSFEYSTSDFEVMFEESGGFDSNAAWVKSGIEDGNDPGSNMPTSPDSVDVTKDANSLNTIVRAAAGRQRVLGWSNRNVGVSVGDDKHLRGKFYIYVSNASGAPVNEVPNFRIRVENGGAAHGTLNVVHATTGNTGPAAPNANPNPDDGNQPYNVYALTNNPAIEVGAGQYLRPSGDANKPSLYRVDLDPVDVPAQATVPVAVTIESFATTDPAAGTLSLTEVVVGSYPALATNPSDRIFLYDRRDGANAAAQGLTATLGGFTHDNEFRPGYKQALQIGQPFDTTPPSQLATMTDTGAGITIDTVNGQNEYITVGIMSIQATSNAAKPRIQPGKMYKARFYASSNLPAWSNNSETVRQSWIRFRIQTAMGVWNSYQEILGPKNHADNSDDRTLYTQLAPSAGSQNPEVLVDGVDLRTSGHGGGWYSVVTDTPLNPDIRPDVMSNPFGTLATQPGPGDSDDSGRDILLGVDIQKQPRTLKINDDPPIPLIPANRATVTIHRIELYEYDQIDDGGYAY